MTVLWANTDFEAGTDGTAITSSNSPFDSIIPAGAWTFSSAHVLSPGGGTLAAKASPSAQIQYLTTSTAMWTGVTKLYYRFYWYCEVMPSANSTLCFWRQFGSGTFADSPRVLTTGVVQIRNSSSTQVAQTSSGFVSAGNYYRFEGMIDVANAQQQIKIFSGANANGTTADFDSGVVASSVGTFTACDQFQLGYNNSTTATGHFDNMQVNDSVSGWVGPIASPASGDAKVWSGTAWAAKPVKVWNGTAWVKKPVKVWNGTSWVTTTY